MREIEKRKLKVLSELINSYEFYRGKFESSFEKNLKKAKDLIDDETYCKLFQSFEKYKYDLLSILARSKKIFVKFSQSDIIHYSCDNCNDKFYQLEDFE